MCGRWSHNFLHVYDTFYVAQPCCTKLYDQIAVRVDAPWFGTLNHGATRCVKFENFHPGGSIFPRTFAPVVRKVSLHDFLPVLVALRPKILIRYFRPWSDPLVLLTKVRPKAIYVRYFRPWCDYFPISELSTSGATNGRTQTEIKTPCIDTTRSQRNYSIRMIPCQSLSSNFY